MKRHHRVAVLLALILTTSGCAQRIYTRPGATASDFDHDKAACDYQAVAATANGGTYGMNTAIGAGIAQGMKQAELEDLCLKASGWRLQSAR